MPSDSEARRRFWLAQSESVSLIGGTGPKKLKAPLEPLSLPRIIHVHVDQGLELEGAWSIPLGVYAKNSVYLQSKGCPVSLDYLRKRGLLDVPKVLVISGQDKWLAKFLASVGEPFFDSLREANFVGVICPNLSAYHHVEHRIWLDNRSLIQQFMGVLLGRDLPGVLFSYLEDSDEHQEWLKEYFRLTLAQDFVATGFDRNGTGRFLRRRIELLAEVQDSIGRPLNIVLNCVLTRLSAVQFASRFFPGRVHLLGQSVFQRSVQGSSLALSSRGILTWTENDLRFRKGAELLLHNTQVLEGAIAAGVPSFYYTEAA